MKRLKKEEKQFLWGKHMKNTLRDHPLGGIDNANNTANYRVQLLLWHLNNIKIKNTIKE